LEWGNNGVFEFIIQQAPEEWQNILRTMTRTLVTHGRPKEVLASFLKEAAKAKKKPIPLSKVPMCVMACLKHRYYEEGGFDNVAVMRMRRFRG
jgi:hypothetical protein